MTQNKIPAFAILGHPNEGKSSVVSTLAEDDSVRISPIPGETKKSGVYPVEIDGREVIRFIDTPGFQNPRQTLDWFRSFKGPDHMILKEFLAAHQSSPEFSDECELLSPLADGAGIIFVVDGSRPLRNTDKIEMEILRMTGLPRMAVINAKEVHHAEFLEDWRTESRKYFNNVRKFDAHRATYAERIDLLESLKMIDQDWQPALAEVIKAFKQNWQFRINYSSQIITDMLKSISQHRIKKSCKSEDEVPGLTKQLQSDFQNDVVNIERSAHKKIRQQFKHNIFNYELPAYSIIKEDLFAKKSWRLLGLKQWQIAAAGGGGGGAVGAKIDLALAGLGFGVFTAIGGLIGAGSAAYAAKQAAGAKVKGLPLGRLRVQVGPLKNEQFLFIILDRALIYFSHVINWAHSRRDQPGAAQINEKKSGFISKFAPNQKQKISQFISALRKGDPVKTESLNHSFQLALTGILNDISILKKPVE
jgi:GTPase Era involved in 16S rRNA processing